MRRALKLLALLALLVLPATASAQTVIIRDWPTDPIGRNSDAAVTPGAAGTTAGKLRQISADIAAMRTALEILDNIVTSNRAQVDVISVPADPFGTNADAAATAGGTGSVQAKLRRLTADLASVLTSVQALGDVNDASVAAGAAGTLSAKVRRLSTDIDTIRTQLAGTLTMTCTNCSAGAGGASQSDRTTFTDGAGGINPIAGYYSTASTDPSSGQAAAVAITQKRAMKVTIYDAAGNEQTIGGGTQYDEDTPHVSGDKLTLAGAVRRDSPTSGTTTDGDRATFNVDVSGRLYVNPSLPSGASTLTEQQSQTSVLGATGDALVAAGATGSVSAKLRRLTTDLEAVRALLAGTQTVTGPLTDAQLRASAPAVNASGFTVPISAATLPNPTGAPTLSSIQDVEAAMREMYGTSGTPSTTLLSVTGGGAAVGQSIAVRCVNSTNDGFESCSSGSGGVATETSLAKLTQTQGSTTSGQSGPLVLGAVTTNPPSYSTGQSSPLSLQTDGSLRSVLIDIKAAGTSVMRTISGSQSVNVWNLRAFDATNDHIAVQGESASGAANSGRPVKVGGVFNTTTPTFTNGQTGDAQLTARGAFHVSLYDAAGSPVSVGGGTQYAEDTATADGQQLTMAGVVRRDTATSGVTTDGDRTELSVDAVGRLYVNVAGAAAHDAAVAGNPVLMGFEARNTDGTAVTNGDAVRGKADTLGKQIVVLGATHDRNVSGRANFTTTTAADIIAAQGAGIRIVVTCVRVSNAHATVGTKVEIRDGTTVKEIMYAGAAGGGWSACGGNVIYVSTANAAVTARAVTTGADVEVNISGYTINN